MRRMILALVAVVAVGSVIFASGGGVSNTSANHGLTGQWDIGFNFNGGGTCNWELLQADTLLFITGACNFAGEVALSGTIDPATGQWGAVGAAVNAGAFCDESLTLTNGTSTITGVGGSLSGDFVCVGPSG